MGIVSDTGHRILSTAGQQYTGIKHQVTYNGSSLALYSNGWDFNNGALYDDPTRGLNNVPAGTDWIFKFAGEIKNITSTADAPMKLIVYGINENDTEEELGGIVIPDFVNGVSFLPINTQINIINTKFYKHMGIKLAIRGAVKPTIGYSAIQFTHYFQTFTLT